MNFSAKCRLCKTLIHSKQNDYVSCGCGEISLDWTAPKIQLISREWENFLRVDENGNEIVIKVEESVSSAKPLLEGTSRPSKDELLGMLNMMIKNLEDLPPQAMSTYVSNYDLLSVLLLFAALFRSDCKEES